MSSLLIYRVRRLHSYDIHLAATREACRELVSQASGDQSGTFENLCRVLCVVNQQGKERPSESKARG